MGLFDKIKNALFEVEYVEVEDQPKKDKKIKEESLEEEVLEEKPIAKKIVLPGKREDKVEHIQEEELIDQDFEARPKDDVLLDNNDNNTPSTSGFKFIDDSDFTVEVEEEPKIIEKIDEDVEVLAEPEVKEVPKHEINTSYSGVSPIQNVEPYSNRSSIAASYKIKERESRPYGMDPNYSISIKEYGSYDNKDEKSYFKPSPIISPIYGILDKNYRKEDVVPKKEVRLTSSYSRTNMNVDDIRNKAYGRGTKEVKVEKTEAIDDKEENLLVDLSDEKEKPEVKEITVGDAMEYFQDLGLEYNVDYVDASSKNNIKKPNDDLEEDIEENLGTKEEVQPEKVVEEVKEETLEEVKKEKKEEVKEKDAKVVEVIDEKKDIDATLSDDDNLFDLIDSMYKEDQN